MDTPRYLTVLRESGTLLADAAEGRFHAHVPTCPEWNVADLVWHVGETHHFWRSIASGEIQDPDDGYVQPERPDEDTLLDWYREGLAETLTVLTALDPEAPRWTWSARQDGGFIHRRMAQETAVHAWDALRAIGGPAALPVDVAVDGVDEFLAYFLGLAEALDLPREPVGPVGVVVLTATDADLSWTVDHTGQHWRVAHGAHRADTTVEGTASDLLLALWRRIGTDTLRIDGDGEALARFLSVAETE
ncbi:maleylpyruvate isomerase family mycothiol-dependent enzyme [Nocardiopsis sp. NPDC006938]|uniref:maleylpyruvate isomerase family mycothiol-dependent enzyme n=1 Tax=Nocardiopsis sp. NPDC006938 TaxID=3364337 RepID=UPI00368062F3